jgi:hypothetical protein
MEFQNHLPLLVQAFPRLFKGKEPTTRSEIPEGWYPLMTDLCQQIDAQLSEGKVEDFVVLQIKEKFGSLRFYFQCAPCTRSKLEQLISIAHERSKTTCLLCGSEAMQIEKDPNAPLCFLCSERLKMLSSQI